MTDSSTPTSTPPLPFTGERFTPECVREIWYEHWHRYAFVRPLAAGKRVLDAACGEGYGSAFLAAVAGHVTGVDLDESTVGHACARYADIGNLDFRQGSVSALDIDEASFDLIVSFETIEHLREQEDMLDEFRRVLKPDGLLVISSPDRNAYNAQLGEPNPFHVRELDRSEFEAMLRLRFPIVRLFGQKIAFHSVIWRQQSGGDAHLAENIELDTSSGRLACGFDMDPVYHLAMAAAHERCLPLERPDVSLFADRQTSLYNHYNGEIARLIRADHRIMALESELAALKAERQSSE